MKVSELFRELSYGELSNLAISGSGSGTIITAKQPQVIQMTRKGLTALFSRFLLRQKDLVVEQMAGITTYVLSSKHSWVQGSAPDDLYIKDTEDDPFKDDLLKVLEVWNVEGFRMALNDRHATYSLFTPTPSTLQVPEPVDGQPFALVYQADHPTLLDVAPEGSLDNFLLDQIIDIPHYLNNALQLYVAHKVFSGMTGQENLLKSQELLAAYETDCLRVELGDLASQSSHTSHTKLESRGFV